MSRRNRHRKQRLERQRAASKQALDKDFERLAAEVEAGGDILGISHAQAIELVEIGLRDLRDRMTREGYASRAPWGLVIDPRALRKSLETGLLLFRAGDDELGRPDDVTEDQAILTTLQTVGGCITLAAAALLYLEGLPLPFDAVKHLTSRELTDDGRVEG
jgi:hypothetical protein